MRFRLITIQNKLQIATIRSFIRVTSQRNTYFNLIISVFSVTIFIFQIAYSSLVPWALFAFCFHGRCKVRFHCLYVAYRIFACMSLIIAHNSYYSTWFIRILRAYCRTISRKRFKTKLKYFTRVINSQRIWLCFA